MLTVKTCASWIYVQPENWCLMKFYSACTRLLHEAVSNWKLVICRLVYTLKTYVLWLEEKSNNMHLLYLPLFIFTCWLLHVSAVACHHQGAYWILLSYLKIQTEGWTFVFSNFSLVFLHWMVDFACWGTNSLMFIPCISYVLEEKTNNMHWLYLPLFIYLFLFFIYFCIIFFF
jgi:hypothetical protein